jgi:hypothetical protein
LAFVEVDDEVHARVLYRSNSQFSWRMCDATDGGHIGKGFHEFDKQVPIPVSVALLKLHNQPQELNSLEGLVSQSELANMLLRGLTLNRKSSQCISQTDGHYYTREYAAFMPSQPMPFTRITQWLTTPAAGRVADPQATQLPPRQQLPDLNKPIAVFAFASSAYSVVNAGDSELTGRVFMSFDGKYRYLFFEDGTGRAALSTVETLHPEINALGLRGRYLDTTGMDSPLMEYYLQIPAEYGGLKQAGYRSNWNYLRELPIIKYYYAEQHREVPALETPATAN